MIALFAGASVSADTSTSILKIQSYDGKNLKGSLTNPYYNEEKAFESTMQALLLMESIFDETAPQSEFNKRSFIKEWHRSDTAAENKKDDTGETKYVATFIVKVIFRQNASWQGVVSRPEMGDEANFRSVFELLLLIDSAMSGIG